MSQRLVGLLKELATITSGYFNSKPTGARESSHGQIENYNINPSTEAYRPVDGGNASLFATHY